MSASHRINRRRQWLLEARKCGDVWSGKRCLRKGYGGGDVELYLPRMRLHRLLVVHGLKRSGWYCRRDVCRPNFPSPRCRYKEQQSPTGCLFRLTCISMATAVSIIGQGAAGMRTSSPRQRKRCARVSPDSQNGTALVPARRRQRAGKIRVNCQHWCREQEKPTTPVCAAHCIVPRPAISIRADREPLPSAATTAMVTGETMPGPTLCRRLREAGAHCREMLADPFKPMATEGPESCPLLRTATPPAMLHGRWLRAGSPFEADNVPS